MLRRADLERLHRLIHSAAGSTVARGRQELAKGRSQVHVIELDHTVLDHGAQVLNALARHNLLVDCHVDLCGRPRRNARGRGALALACGRVCGLPQRHARLELRPCLLLMLLNCSHRAGHLKMLRIR